MIKQDRVYWIVYSKVRKKYPNKPISQKHMIARKAIESRQKKKENKK